ncbi:twin-arginine translocase subunit TatC [bacterium]|nr:twin-arginine translocase subunit TatC [bacterium]
MSEEDKEQTILEHLEELRQTLLDCLIKVAIVLPFAFIIAPKALDFLTKILIGKNQITFNYFAPMEVFIIQIKLALLLDVIVCFPYIAKRLWDFIAPALYENEKNIIKTSVISSTLLFFAGIIFCIFGILPLIINFGMSFASGNMQALFGISNIINLALSLAFVFGLMFQIPLIINVLIKWDIVTYEFISEKRPYVAVILLVLSALFTPPDIISQIMLFTPTYLLFEIGLFLSKKSIQK